MTFHPDDFGKIAEKIHDALQQTTLIPVNDSESEAWIRTAISRAYYSAFLLVNEKSGKTFWGKNAHENLVKYLIAMGGLHAIIGSKLDVLRKNRIKADYWMPPNYFAKLNTLKWSISILQDIRSKLGRCFP